MIDKIRADRYGCYQHEIVDEIEKTYGRDWVYENDNGNPAISPKVLREFRKLHGGSIEWDNGEKSWSVVRPRTR